jgi:adenine-specific DNA-methyltransferase
MKKLDGLTLDLVSERIEELKAVFPEVFKDGKIDFGALQNALGEYVEDPREKYSFTWAGKLDSIRIAQKRSTGTLRPCKEESAGCDGTAGGFDSDNLYIEGDNLEVLKLLSGSYMNSIKMIYIDPPYNTGNDFVYNDSFGDSIEHYKKVIGETAKSNAETAGRYHTNWLNMMLPRLKLARVLLKPEGVICISIDDNELINLRKLCDEVFGEHNFIAQVIVQTNPRGRTFDKYIAKTHEYVVIYTKTIDVESMHEVPKDDKAIAGYQKEDGYGKYRLLELRNRNPVFNRKNRPLMFYPIYADAEKLDVSLVPTERHTIEIYPRNSQGEDGCWTWGLEKAKNEASLLVANLANTGKWSVFRKDYLEGSSLYTKAKSIWADKEMNHENGKEMVGELFGKTPFDFPKSVDYIKKCLQLSTSKDDNEIVIDFFSGSATTAHAVMQLNAEDGGNRKFICVQLPEITDENSEAFKAGYKNICEIGKERIRRAGSRIKADSPLTKAELDTGFKVFKLDTSNLKKWNNSYTRDYEDIQRRIVDYYDYLVPNRTPLDMVYEIMLKYSLPLTLPIEEVTAAGALAHIINHAGNEIVDTYKVLVCMQEDLTIEQMEALSDLGAGTLFFADKCFTDTNAMTNCDEIIKKVGQDMRLF